MKFTQLGNLVILAAIVHGQVTSERLVGDINAITDLSSQTDDLTQSISITNFFSTAPELINNFQQIIELVSNDIVSTSGNVTRKIRKRQNCANAGEPKTCAAEVLEPAYFLETRGHTGSPATHATLLQSVEKRQTAPPYTQTNQLAICDAFREFVLVHQQLLATVIGKHGLLSQTPFTQPLAQILRVLEGGVDTLAFAIIDAVPTCAGEATDNKSSLDDSLQDAVNTYNS